MNSFGRIFRISIFGESHGQAVGVIIDGCPAGIPLCEDDLLPDLNRRKSGAKGTTQRAETDRPELLSGMYNGYTTGAPITVITRNTGARPGDYDNLKEHPRPGHADFAAQRKYSGFNDPRGGGHFSGRLTWGLVAAGAVAKKIISPAAVKAVLAEAGGNKDIDSAVEKAIKNSDSIGGIVECRVTDPPSGLGEPFFDSLESLVSHIVFAIPGIKGIEFGSGFRSAQMKGSEHNDMILDQSGKTATNHAGGVNGGITNGNELIFRVAVKPTSSISLPQQTFHFKSGKTEELIIKGRHDACIALRMPVIVEAATAVVLADLLLLILETG
ncbi:MAG: chorismate synthase [Bacteroidetes bacterium]|nr:chorismate synthase [Bacteroidota bacterium]